MQTFALVGEADGLIRDGAREAVREVVDIDDTNHPREIERLQRVLEQAYYAELEYWREREADTDDQP